MKECEVCGQIVVEKFFEKHQKEKHSEISIRHKCDFCEYEAKRKDHVYSHMKHKHNTHNMDPNAIRNHFSNNESFTCTDCKRTFSNAKTTIHHMRLSNCEEVSCEICEKDFSSRSNLNKHKKKFHK